VPLDLVGFHLEPFEQYQWMNRWGLRWILVFCAKHLRNFIWEQQLLFEKVGDRNE